MTPQISSEWILNRIGNDASCMSSWQLVNTYVMTSREVPLNTAACRLLQNIMPGLETAVVFQEKVEPPPTVVLQRGHSLRPGCR